MAQKAAREFVDAQPAGTRMGLVVFSGFAELAVAPTTDRKALENAINNLTTGPGTAIGAAMLQALDAIAEVEPRGPAGRQRGVDRRRRVGRSAPGLPAGASRRPARHRSPAQAATCPTSSCC